MVFSTTVVPSQVSETVAPSVANALPVKVTTPPVPLTSWVSVASVDALTPRILPFSTPSTTHARESVQSTRNAPSAARPSVRLPVIGGGGGSPFPVVGAGAAMASSTMVVASQVSETVAPSVAKALPVKVTTPPVPLTSWVSVASVDELTPRILPFSTPSTTHARESVQSTRNAPSAARPSVRLPVASAAAMVFLTTVVPSQVSETVAPSVAKALPEKVTVPPVPLTS